MPSKIKALIVSALALLGCGNAARAAIVSWGTPANITGDTDVSTVGTTVYAYDWAGNNETVNGVAFTGVTTTNGATPNVSIITSINAINNNTGAFTSGSAPFSGLSSAYQDMLIGADYSSVNDDDAKFIVTMFNLTAGHIYYVQVWVNDPRSGGTATRTETLMGSDNVPLDYSANQTGGSPGQYAIGSFTAAGPAQSFTLQGSDSTQLNALQLRDTGLPATISYAGTQFDLGSGWRTGALSESLDIDGDDVLGSDGYNMVNVAPVQPNYVASSGILSSTYSGNGGYYSIDDPNNLPNLFLTGTMNPSPGQNNNANDFYFILNGNAIGRTIRVGLMVDNLDFTSFNAASLEIIQTNRNLANSGSVATVSSLYNDGIPDWIFFDIENATAGDGFIIEGTGGESGTVTLGGVAFDSAVAEPPTAADLAATSLATNSASLNATVSPNGVDTQYYFLYGTTPSFGSVTTTNTVVAGVSPVSVSSVLGDLLPQTTYYYQVVVSNYMGTNVGAQTSFTTLATPVATTEAATLVYATNATLNATIYPGNPATSWYFQYGTNQNYGSFTVTNTVPAGNSTVNVSVNLTGLVPGATYYYEVVAENSAGSSYGVQLAFTNGSILVVSNNADNGSAGSLRAAIQSAVSGDTITFSNTLSGSIILLTNGQIPLNKSLTIDGSTLSSGIVINGNTNGGIFQVPGNNTVVLNSLTITNGLVSAGNGGGINNKGTLTLNQCTLSGNAATAGNIIPALIRKENNSVAGGGGIFNSGTLTLNQCTLFGNSAIGANPTIVPEAFSTFGGGGIYNDGTLTLNQCTLSGNSATNVANGGGIYNEAGALILNQCTLSGNSAPFNGGGGGNGGGIFDLSTAPISITNSIVAGNTIGGSGQGADIFNSSVLTYGGTNLVEFEYNNGGGTLTGTTAIDAPPNLAPLGNYGSPTQTMLPLTNSPAIDAGLNSAATNLFATDQRGYPRLSGLLVDIGAVELQQAVTATLPASNITATTAMLDGTVTPNDLETAWYFQYGLTTSYGADSTTNTLDSGFNLVDVSNDIGGLAPATTYHYQILANDGVSIKAGADANFTTLDAAPSPVTAAATGIFSTNAVLNATINPNGAATQYYFAYGPTPSYGFFSITNTVPAGNSIVDVSTAVTGLAPGTPYYYQVVAINSLGGDNGIQLGFTTGSILVVTSPNDSGPGSLRQAVLDASSGDTITFANTLDNMIIFLNQPIMLANNLIIDGSALKIGVTISGTLNGSFQVSDATVVLNSLHMLGELEDFGTLTLNECSVQDGGINCQTGILTLNDCILSDNTIPTGGGGINCQYSTMTLNQCTLSGNSANGNANPSFGGGIYSQYSTLTLNQCTLINNTALGFGGGIYSQNCTLTLNECTLSGNSTGFGGGGIYSQNCTLTLNECTLSGNLAVPNGFGGGIYCDGPAAVILNQCTLSGNSAANGGGGLFNQSPCSIFNSIIAGNTTTSGPGADILNQSFLTYTGPNIVQFASGGTIVGAPAIEDPPNLAPLGNYGGPTQTMPPLTNSPAVDAGSDNAINTFATDQRGYPRLSGLHVDIGAVELQQAATATLPASNITATTALLSGTVTPNDTEPIWYFQYGTTISYGSDSTTNTLDSGFDLVDVSNTISGLAPATTYHYQILANDGVSIKTGADATFTTLDAAPSPVTVAATGVYGISATLNATINPNGAATQYYFAYGPTANYGFFSTTNTVPAGNSIVNVSAIVSGLAPGTPYFYQVVAVNGLGGNDGAQLGFTTGGLLVVLNANDSGAGSLRSIISGASSGDTITFSNILSGSNILLTSGQITLANNLTIDGSTLANGIVINGNGSGRIFNLSGANTVVLDSLTITNGVGGTGINGGGIFNNGTLTLNQCTLSGNSTTVEIAIPDAVRNESPAPAPDPPPSFGGGGGIFNNGTLTLNQCTLSGNSVLVALGSGGGGSIFNQGALTLNQCTLSGNSVRISGESGGGGGIFNNGTLVLDQCTLSGNSAIFTGSGSGGGGIYHQIGAFATITNSIVAGNTGGGIGAGADIYSTSFNLTFGGSNIVASIDNVNFPSSGPSPLNAAPNLAPLGNYGGPTQTMPPLTNSPAVDAGSDSANIFTTDQRGYPRLSGLHVDIGAVELQQATVATLPASAVTATTASVNGTVTPNELTPAWYFQYGTTTSYGASSATNTLSPGFSLVNVSNALSSLTPATTYHYRIAANDGVSIKTGADATFTTPPIAPVAVTGSATNIAEGAATLNATLNPGYAETGWYFQYGLTTNFGFFTSTNTVAAGSSAVSVSNVLNLLEAGAIYYYQVVATNSAGTNAGATLAFTNPTGIVIVNSQVVVAITSPANKSPATNSSITVKGTIKGGGASPQLQVTVNTNAPVLAVNGAATHAAIPWSCIVPLALGANVITAQTIDTNGTEVLSAPATITVFYATNPLVASDKSTLTLTASPSGRGKFTGETSKALLEVNKGYTVKAVPVGNWIFTNWTLGADSNSILGYNASLSFVMMSNLVLQANFVTNPFPAVLGAYNGLFAVATNLSEESSGFFSAAMSSSGSGAYTAKLLLDGGSYSFSGSFDLSGDSETTLTRAGKPPVEVILHLNLDQPASTNQMTGYVVNFASNGWTSALQADRAAFSKSNPTTSYAGKYTLIIPPGGDATSNSPGGYSYATLAGTASGVVTLSGSLSDKTSFSQSVAISTNGNVPLYVSLYAKKGSLQGWLTLTNEPASPASPVQMIVGTNLAWFRTGVTHTNLSAIGSLYTGGFTLTNSVLTLVGGGVSVSNNVSVSGNDLTGTNTAITGKITPGTGVLTLTYKPEGGAKITAKGVVLQDSTGTNAAGWFLDAGDSGYFLLQQ